MVFVESGVARPHKTLAEVFAMARANDAYVISFNLTAFLRRHIRGMGAVHRAKMKAYIEIHD